MTATLNERDIRGLMLFNKMLSGKGLSEDEKQTTGEFILRCVEDKNFNVLIRNMDANMKNEHKIHIFLTILTHCTRSLPRIENKFDAISASHKKLVTLITLEEGDKISLEDYAILYDLKKLVEICLVFEKNGLTQMHPKLKILQTRASLCNELDTFFEGVHSKVHDANFFAQTISLAGPYFTSLIALFLVINLLNQNSQPTP